MPRIDYEKLLQEISIEDVASRLGMAVKKTAAHQYKTLCPFHDDKTPSLLIDASRDKGRQHYYCFACGAHGDAIELVKGQLNLSFREAVAWLTPNSPKVIKERQDLPRRQALTDGAANLPALQFGYNLYEKHSNEADLIAWIKKRRLNAAVLKRAGLAYANQNLLSRRLEKIKDRSVWREQAGDLEDAFLIRKLIPGVSKDMHLILKSGEETINRYSDYFIGDRVVFPIRDQTGTLLGLVGRAAANAVNTKTPKYQFTRGFPKAQVLYRADYAFKLIRGAAKAGQKDLSIYLCEGFLDALRFESLGFPAVAVMGSSISDLQVKLLKELQDSLSKDTVLNVVVSFDRDEAGLRGASEACLKLLKAPIESAFLWPNNEQIGDRGSESEYKDPNDYLEGLTSAEANQLLESAIYPAEIAVLAYSFGVTAEEILVEDCWAVTSRTRRYRAFGKATKQIANAVGDEFEPLLDKSKLKYHSSINLPALNEWLRFIADDKVERSKSYSEDFLSNTAARLNHSRILAYMGSRRGELPCDEPRWERLDIAATVFNTLLLDRLDRFHPSGPIGPYNAVWVPRSFGGSESRLKIMPLPEDLIIQQYLLNEILTERWDLDSIADIPFSRRVPAVRYYRENQSIVTTGIDIKGEGDRGALTSQTLSFAYQIDMDVLEGRQPASDQGMYRPFSECWRDFMESLVKQASEIGYVYSIRLDVKRYYDQLQRHIVRDRILGPLTAAIASVHDDTPDFAGLHHFKGAEESASSKAASVLDRLDEYLFGVSYTRPDTGFSEQTKPMMGIPQGPVLSAWVGTIALFPVDEEAYRIIKDLNVDKTRVGYARYVDDIVLLADDPEILAEMREAIDLRARKLKLTLLAKAEEIPAMSAEDFTAYINEGRALAAYGPAWEPPLVGDGEAGWEFWSVAPSTDRQSALQLLHNVELYKASQSTLLKTVKTAFNAPDLRASELSKAARLIWYAIAVEHLEDSVSTHILPRYIEIWDNCVQESAWNLDPKNNSWESPILFALEGLEHLIDKQSFDISELSAKENELRRRRILWLAEVALTPVFKNYVFDSTHAPVHQLRLRLQLLGWKATRLLGKGVKSGVRDDIERSRLVQRWQPFEWMHEAIAALSEADDYTEDPLDPFVEQVEEQVSNGAMKGFPAEVFRALLPSNNEQQSNAAETTLPNQALSVALQTLVSIVPREQLPNCLIKRHHLIWESNTTASPTRLVLPPLPGIKTTRVLSCVGGLTDENGLVAIQQVQGLDFRDTIEEPQFFGVGVSAKIYQLSINWRNEPVLGHLTRLAGVIDDDLCVLVRDRIEKVNTMVSADTLKLAAKLYRAIARLVTAYANDNSELELVPAWPYIALDKSNDSYCLLAEGVPRDELGNRAFVRDGGRALRTVEVPIYEANLWRVGIAISDYLGLYDDFVKFSAVDSDVTLDAAALSNPARYVLRTQLRKLRGAYANSQISRRRDDEQVLPASVARSLRLLEMYPEDNDDTLSTILYVLAAETESAGMYLAFSRGWNGKESGSFLALLVHRVLARLPVSVGQVLSSTADNDAGIRRDLLGLLCFARQIFAVPEESSINSHPSWNALRAGVISTGISVGFKGLIASLRSHDSFARYENFDFPSDWGIPPSPEISNIYEQNLSNNRPPLIDQCRELLQYLGHRLVGDVAQRLSVAVQEKFAFVAKALAEIDYYDGEEASHFEWPFQVLSDRRVNALNLELLGAVVKLIRMIDDELQFETVLVVESSYGYNAQTKRFTDSRSGVRDVTQWMISQFPEVAKHIEEVSQDGEFLRVWTEVFDRRTGKLLSVSALGEPFASISITKPSLDSSLKAELPETTATASLNMAIDDELTKKSIMSSSFNQTAEGATVVGPEDSRIVENNKSPVSKSRDRGRDADSMIDARFGEFLKTQSEQWARRGEDCKPSGLVRIALLQADFDLTYQHPFVEVNPIRWPFNKKVRNIIAQNLKSDASLGYDKLLLSAESHNSAHRWTTLKYFPSWSEHRRQRILGRVIDCCVVFGVDLLVLPEYSVRPETLVWLKQYIANKNVSVLAGTYINLDRDNVNDYLSAPLTLLWPVPKSISNIFSASLKNEGLGHQRDYDALSRGPVLEFSRNKKYRSIALEEFFRPPAAPLKPLFEPGRLALELEKIVGFKPSVEVISHLLADTRLPLKYLLELICSEAFLVSSPANYVHMGEDLKTMWRRFGGTAKTDEVLSDVKVLSEKLSITGNGKEARRSILAVPAATSRSADYWLAGQAGFLAAGTTTVFCNSIDGGTLVGGSCFIGRGSWKSEETALGYLAKVTPYHGWSKGIYFNNKNDALSKSDQAMVIADIDPHNMLEGKPRAQTMPSPLQLVAYLPLIESVDWSLTQSTLLENLSVEVTGEVDLLKPCDGSRLRDERQFWNVVGSNQAIVREEALDNLWRLFPDPAALASRAKAYLNDGAMQPTASQHSKGIFCAPALYDWINVSLTLSPKEALPEIGVPPWK